MPVCGMSNSWFRFKRFVVEQSDTAMKVGTDGVLLGAWARVLPGPARYLDIGTGTGVIALMLAQRTEDVPGGATVDAVEVDGAGAVQAAANAASSPWSHAVRVYRCGIGIFRPGVSEPLWGGRDAASVPDGGEETAAGDCSEEGESASVPPELLYHHIVSNPPWFVDSLPSPHAGRRVARHADSLPYGELLQHAARLLAPEGLFSVVLPADSEERFLAGARVAGFGLNRRTRVFTLPGISPKRVLLEFAFAGSCGAMPVEDTLTIETGEGPGSYTDEYRRLTGDFYLRF